MKKILLFSLPLILLACLSTLGYEPPVDLAPSKTAIATWTPKPSPAAPPETASPAAACATVDTDSLHVRYQPNEHAQAVGWVTEGATLKILEPGDWPKISGYGIDDQGRRARMTGYVNSNYLKECLP